VLLLCANVTPRAIISHDPRVNYGFVDLTDDDRRKLFAKRYFVTHPRSFAEEYLGAARVVRRDAKESFRKKGKGTQNVQLLTQY